jgi:Flp pilus assembly protein TadD
VEDQPHQVAGRALVKANEGTGVPLFVHPVILPPEWVYGVLVPQGVLFRVEPEGYQPTGEDRRRHTTIMRRWAPALQDSLERLDGLSRDIWSYQHELQGDAWAQLGMWDIAELEYQAGLRINPRRVEPWVALGAFHAATGDWGRAMLAYLGALELAPGDVVLSFELTRSLTNLGRFAEADSLLPRAEPPGTPRAEYLQLRARIQGGLGEFDASRADLEEAAALAPESGEIQNDLGVLLLTAGEREAARQVLERAVQLEPDLAEAWSNLGTLAFQDGRTSEAETAFLRAIESGADAPQIRHTLGLLRFTTGNPAGAETILRENLQLWPRHADTYMTLGAVLETRGNLREAIAIFEQGRMANPADSRFSRELRRLRGRPPS